MKITITSAAGSLFSHDSFDRITIMTETGEITVLPKHEPLLSVVRPGVMYLEYTKDGEKRDEEYITGGGVITISPDEVVIVIDSIDDVTELDSEENIMKLKEEAEKMIKIYHNENPTDKDAQQAMELEYQYLKYAAMLTW